MLAIDEQPLLTSLVLEEALEGHPDPALEPDGAIEATVEIEVGTL